MSASLSRFIPQSLLAANSERIMQQRVTQLAKTRLWWIGVSGQDKPLMIYDRQTRLLWEANPATDRLKFTDAKNKFKNLTCGYFSGWRLPEQEEITDFSKVEPNPLRTSKNHGNRLLGIDYWVIYNGCIDLDNFSMSAANSGALLACHDFLRDCSPETVIRIADARGWSLTPTTPAHAENIMQVPLHPSLIDVYRSLDYAMARLPQLETAQFTDPNKGLWEFWGMEPELLAEQQVRARNPAQDVRDWNVAIDFGTSSTVVAYDENDQHKLLRIGVRDYWEKEKPEHYENPTVLEFIDFLKMLSTWQTEAYRPCLLWEQVRCSHEALANFRHHNNDPQAVASILTRIKQWALRESKGNRLRLTDRQNHEHELAALSLRVPVKGQPLTVSSDDPFDPIELYAWFLGLTINWRGRGIFLRYYMTFPVAYPREVKDKILASFQRGLQRSLPTSLIKQPVFRNFLVEERATEPTAYAAVALEQLGIQPTAEGVAYAVFDFGGGTVDFDYGYYRLPTPTEEDEEGKERVLEHCGSGGDPFLGGENLLENMAYQVFRDNLDLCRTNKIAFTRPLDADDFPGSEMFLEQTQAATSNTIMLMSKLRPLWETGQLESTASKGVTALDLLSKDGHKVQCPLKINEEQLKKELQTRIATGIANFFTAMVKAFTLPLPKQVHILLAGNASRSDLVKQLFEEFIEELEMQFTIHPPLAMDAANPYRPTAKTGVALGLLLLCPGSVVKVVNRAQDHSRSGDEAPFGHYVGRIRLNKFQAGILQGGEYHRWYELGIPSEGVFNLYHTQSPVAHTGEMTQGTPGLFKQRIDLAGDTRGQKVFARIISPSAIELCTAVSMETVQQDNGRSNLMRLELD